jgi:hypothetical protein
MSDRYEHMDEAWGIERNPFPAEAINRGEDDPYSPEVFPEEMKSFHSKLVYSAAMDQRGFSFLWSKGPNNDDTGMGKTTLLKQAAKEINEDFGERVLGEAGMKPTVIEKHKSIAAYASFDTTSANGIYPVLFAIVEYLADPANGSNGVSVLDTLRSQIREEHGLEDDDDDGLRDALRTARRKLGATLPLLRADAVDAFCNSKDGEFADSLAEISSASRIRSGLDYFDFAFTVAMAAGVKHVFLFIDQLEDLATVRSVTKAKRSKEVGRLRDIIAEKAPFVGRVHSVFTFHTRAAEALDEFWRQNRLPSYDAEDQANKSAVVVLRGIRDISQARTLLVTYLDTVRSDPKDDGELAPFDESALPVLLQRSGGRAGILLSNAYELLNQAADDELPNIDGKFAARILGMKAVMTVRPRRGAATEDLYRDFDPLLK